MRQKQGVFSLFLLSPSSRRAWIEIMPWPGRPYRKSVALLAEGVDRNISAAMTIDREISVALLAEGVDRNRTDLTFALIRVVALLAEGVDRNLL